jgi:hypothetical protein
MAFIDAKFKDPILYTLGLLTASWFPITD